MAASSPAWTLSLAFPAQTCDRARERAKVLTNRNFASLFSSSCSAMFVFRGPVQDPVHGSPGVCHVAAASASSAYVISKDSVLRADIQTPVRV